MNISKDARRDAVEYARAQMYFGEGAGNRRKLITASVAAKMERYPAYRMVFNKEIARQDMSKHAALARKERRRKDVAHAINRNVKAAAAGRYGGVNAAVLVGAVGVYYAHQTGYDKKVAAQIRVRYLRLKARLEKSREKADAKVHDITSAASPASRAQ